MDYQNSIMEDLGAIIGYHATNRLIAVFGGASLYIPAQIDASHPIARVTGAPAAARLVEAFGGETLANLPDNEEFYRLRRIRQVAGLLRGGMSPREISTMVGVSTKQIGRYRTEAEEMALLPLVFDARAGESA